MIDERFSDEEFRRAGLDTAEARALVEALKLEVVAELDPIVRAAMQSIVDRLNALGHHLVVTGGDELGDVNYYDYDPESQEWHKDTRLRLALTSIVSAGYRDMVRYAP
jgi:hypothetical protein